MCSGFRTLCCDLPSTRASCHHRRMYRTVTDSYLSGNTTHLLQHFKRKWRGFRITWFARKWESPTKREKRLSLVNQHRLDVLSVRSPTTITAGTTYRSLLLRSVSNHHCAWVDGNDLREWHARAHILQCNDNQDRVTHRNSLFTGTLGALQTRPPPIVLFRLAWCISLRLLHLGCSGRA